MATHSSILAWEISWTEQPGRLQSRGSQRVRHNLSTEPRMAKAGPCVQCIMMCTKAGSERNSIPLLIPQQGPPASFPALARKQRLLPSPQHQGASGGTNKCTGSRCYSGEYLKTPWAGDSTRGGGWVAGGHSPALLCCFVFLM